MGAKRIFECDKPDRENKLTMKMQTYSPQPCGFVFKYCTDYYYIALPLGQRTSDTCTKDTTKFKLSVACKGTQKAKSTTAKTTTTATTAETTVTTTTTKTKGSRLIPTTTESGFNPKVNRVHQHAKSHDSSNKTPHNNDESNNNHNEDGGVKIIKKHKGADAQQSIGSGASSTSLRTSSAVMFVSTTLLVISVLL